MKKKHSPTPAVVPDRTDFRVGEIAVSTAGHDAGLIFVIIAGIDDRHVLVADGKARKLAAPKKKKMRHLSIFTRLSEEDTEKLRNGSVNDSFLRKTISSLDLEQLNQS